ncbi:hypothetical protein BT69DRAFT_1303931 [Atractiella rhizophila]|nr:hypothetical protein BT69DRAFT_1303931 [Atractiella rhizophila]
MAQVKRAVKAIVEDGSCVANQMKMKMQEQPLDHRYHRFSVHTVGSIKWEEWERTQVVVSHTKAYMDVMSHKARHAADHLVQVRRWFLLPPPGSCFGREAEIELVREAVLRGRHVAIVGGAGNGKSAVALDTFPDLTATYFGSRICRLGFG